MSSTHISILTFSGQNHHCHQKHLCLIVTISHTELQLLQLYFWNFYRHVNLLFYLVAMTTKIIRKTSLNSILPLPLFSFLIFVMNHKVIFTTCNIKRLVLRNSNFCLIHTCKGEIFCANREIYMYLDINSIYKNKITVYLYAIDKFAN